MKGLGYLRVSTEEQATEGVSLEAQEAAIASYAAMRGITLVETITDAGVSAKRHVDAREGGQRVHELVHKGGIDAVLVYKLDRLWRSTIDCLQCVDLWEKKGTSVHFIDLGGQPVDSSTATGRWILTMMAASAEMERRLIGERTSAAMQHKKAKGEFTGGHAPYGWRVAEDGVSLVAHDGEQTIIKAALRLRDRGISLRKIGKRLEEEGLLPRSGGMWNPKTVRSLVRAKVA